MKRETQLRDITTTEEKINLNQRKGLLSILFTILSTIQGSTLTAARLPGVTKNFIRATKFRILVAPSSNCNFYN